MEQPYVLFILYCQYHSCWCSGILRSQGISKHGIDQIRQNIPSLASEDIALTWTGDHLIFYPGNSDINNDKMTGGKN